MRCRGIGDRSCSSGSAMRQMAGFGLVRVVRTQGPVGRQPVISGAQLTKAGRARAGLASVDVDTGTTGSPGWQ
jgi:hypothetical protein